ncbi:Serine/threonine-protein kinase AFC1 [Acorus calamus]|uniref:Serine/threonine-protein kinase AFC1 n=1 Tax=Acorus calamus TaxID=4465 RepID=A0AAV9DXX0_ACOCL|nr:Serine/threonine-protein kinase AFC1 [Acorus calamus]
MNNRARSEIPSYQMLSEQEYEARELKKAEIGRNYFKYNKFDDIIMKYPYRRNLNEEDIYKETLIRSALIDLLRGLLEFDPKKRWSPLQASRHPFITGESFICPYRPVPVTPHVDLVHKVEVNVKREGGPWLKGGLSLPGHHADGPTVVALRVSLKGMLVLLAVCTPLTVYQDRVNKDVQMEFLLC